MALYLAFPGAQLQPRWRNEMPFSCPPRNVILERQEEFLPEVVTEHMEYHAQGLRKGTKSNVGPNTEL